MPLRDPGDTLAWIGLASIPGLGLAAQRALLQALGTPAQVLASSRAAVQAVVGGEAAEAFARGADPALIERTARWLEAPDHHAIVLATPEYPERLLEITDPPHVLYAVGRIELLQAPSIAIVGSRNATPMGMRDAYAFANALSDAGLAIVSGHALGIDTHAHRGGLAGRGSSVAVMATGADRIYPAGNRELAHALARDGCLVTEFPLGTPPEKWNFPRRNRLISGLSRGVLVVEAAEGSGSLITARLALEHSRDVFAIPGSIHSALSKGCHKLIKDGAKLVEKAEDVLLELGIHAPAADAPPARRSRRKDPVFDAMGHAPVTVDQIAELIGAEASAVSAQLARLQLDGRVVALAGGWFQRVG